MSSMPVLVIGNGESRRSLDLNQIKSNFITVGCNALHRDMSVDHLICCDGRMVQEAVISSNTINSKIYTRERYYRDYRKIKKNKNVFLLPSLPYQSNARIDNPDHWNSGPYAILLASQLSKVINVIGFDLYGNNNFVNNVYKNTENYSGLKSPAVDPSYWIYQIAKVINLFPQNNYRIYNVPEWKLPREWCQNNVEHHNIGNFNLDIDKLYFSSII